MKEKVKVLGILFLTLCTLGFVDGKGIDTSEFKKIQSYFERLDDAKFHNPSFKRDSINKFIECIDEALIVINGQSGIIEDLNNPDSPDHKDAILKKNKKESEAQICFDKINELYKLSKKEEARENDLKSTISKQKDKIQKLENHNSPWKILLKYWYYIVIPFGFFLFSIVGLLYSLRRMRLNFDKRTSQYESEVIILENEMNILKKSNTNSPAEITNSPNIEYKSSLENVSIPLSSDRTQSFHAETFVSAGPRKSFQGSIEEGDIDLGEDIAGFMVSGNHAAFWVLDGTSGQDILRSTDDRVKLGDNKIEYFSSRLLAQSIAWNLHSLIKKHGFNHSSFDLLREAIRLTQQQWQQNISGLSDSDTQDLKELLAQKNMIICSTTIAFGILSMDREMDLTISGDCIVATHPKQIDLPKNNRRQSANIYIKDNNIVLDFNPLNEDSCVRIREAGIEKVVCMSDGVSKNTQKWISSNVNIDFSNPKIRESLSRLKQKTQDDKSVTIVQII